MSKKQEARDKAVADANKARAVKRHRRKQARRDALTRSVRSAQGQLRPMTERERLDKFNRNMHRGRTQAYIKAKRWATEQTRKAQRRKLRSL